MKKSLFAITILAILFSACIARASNWKVIATTKDGIHWLIDSDSIEYSLEKTVAKVAVKRNDQPNVVLEYVIDNADNTFALYSALDTSKGLFIKLKKDELEWNAINGGSVIEKIASELFNRKKLQV